MTRRVRLQLSRKTGFDLQAWSRATNGLEAVSVARPGRHGNPWAIRFYGRWRVEGPGLPLGGVICGNEEGARMVAVRLFREGVARWSAEGVEATRRALAGKNLACWCAPGAPCHADVLIELANPEPEEG